MTGVEVISKSSGSPEAETPTPHDHFVTFAASHQARLRQALIAKYGTVVGVDAAAAAMGWAWEHWDAVAGMTYPLGYLYRVGQTSTRAHWRWARRTQREFPSERRSTDKPTPDQHGLVDLGDVLARLKPVQRSCVLLVHAHGWRYAEVATTLGISEDAVTNHVHRGLKRLRTMLKEES